MQILHRYLSCKTFGRCGWWRINKINQSQSSRVWYSSVAHWLVGILLHSIWATFRGGALIAHVERRATARVSSSARQHLLVRVRGTVSPPEKTAMTSYQPGRTRTFVTRVRACVCTRARRHSPCPPLSLCHHFKLGRWLRSWSVNDASPVHCFIKVSRKPIQSVGVDEPTCPVKLGPGLVPPV